jgi:hypothetical protein
LFNVAIVNEAAIAIHRIAKTAERSDLEQLEYRLASSSDANLRYLALSALLAQARDHIRWNDSRRERLSSYRNDPAPAVAMRAQFFFEADTSETETEAL